MRQLFVLASLLVVGCGGEVMPLFQPESPLAMSRPTVVAQDRALVKGFLAWVRQKAGGGWRPDPGKLFPGIRCCNVGLEAYAMSPQGGQVAVEVAKVFFRSDSKVQQFRFDPRRHQVFLVEATNDEHELYVAVGDRVTGRFHLLGEHFNSVDVGFVMGKRFASLFPGLDPDDTDAVLEFLHKSGQDLHLSPED